MPNIASATKALRQSKRRRAQNASRKETYKKALKEYRRLVASGKTDEAKKELAKLQKALDKAARSGAIKKNKARRLKSRAAHATAKAKRASS